MRSAPAPSTRLFAVLHDPRRHRPRLRAILSAGARDIDKRRRAQAAAGREHGERFEDVGLARAVRAEQAHRPRIEREIERSVIAEIREREARDVKGVQRYTRSGIST